MFGDLGITEILIILLVILIFFGAKKIPDIAQGFGKGIKEFKKAIKDVNENDKKDAGDSDSDKK
jgi:sec-independent protein translocase protein TatA